jgi:protein TonB
VVRLTPPGPAEPPATGLEPEPAEPPPAPTPTLAPGFDPQRPLGIGETADAAAAPPPSEGTVRPRPRPSAPGTEEAALSLPVADPAELQARYWRAVQAAVARARLDPPAVRDRGVVGMTRIELTVGRDGRLHQARLLRSSGSAALDRASLDAALAAQIPAAPTALGGDSFTFAVDLFFGLD